MKVDSHSMVQTELKYNENQLESTIEQLRKAKEAHTAAKHDAAIEAKTLEMRRLDDAKTDLNASIRVLSLQADSRAKLALKKADMGKKRAEIDVM
jgi:DNA repair protein RAD50